MSWSIGHYDRPDPDVSDFTGEFVTELNPENLKFTLNKGENGPGDISYEVSRSRPIIGPDFVGPYRTYFRLYYGDTIAHSSTTDIVMGGPITMLQVNSREEHAKVGGKTWEHQLELLYWPFDPTNPTANLLGIPSTTAFEPPPGYSYYHSRTTSNLISDLVNFIIGQNHAPYLGIDINSLVNATQLMSIDLADTENLLNKIQALSQSDSDPFDFRVKPYERELEIWGPHQYDVTSVLASPSNCEYHFDKDQEDSGIYNISFTNTGPACTWLLGTGNNVSAELTALEKYTPAQVVYGLMQLIQNFSDIKHKAQLQAITKRYMLFNVNPVHEIELTVVPDKITNFYRRFKPGVPIWLTADLEAHALDSAQEIVSMDVDATNQDNNLVTFKLNQIYEAVTL